MTGYCGTCALRLLMMLIAMQLLVVGPTIAVDLPIDLSKHKIAIHSSFTGATVVLFGVLTKPQGSDVIAVLRGPQQNLVVRKKQKTLGIWINRSDAVFQDVPGYYAMASSGPINKLLELEYRLQNQIGVENVNLVSTDISQKSYSGAYRQALVRHKVKQGLYFLEPAPVEFVRGGLFRLHFSFPSNVIPGTYTANVYEIGEGNILAEGVIELSIRKAGVEERIYQTAHDSPWLYGILAVVLALMAGWLASAIFRKT
jgi:uncharacterized protein (TIGR02186 family)